VPIDGCRTARKAVVTIRERRVGSEHLVFAARGFDAGLPREALGDPVRGPTAYRLCIYDAADRLVGRLLMDRAGDVCGARERPCWRTLEVGGYTYRDPTASADGVRRLDAKAGSPGKGGVRLGARNATRKGIASLPTGVAAALESNDRATVQLVTSDAGCMSVVLDRVQKADGGTFKAKRP
jgi:hypothetical protein